MKVFLSFLASGTLVALGLTYLLLAPAPTPTACDGTIIESNTGIIPVGGVEGEYVIGVSIHPGPVEGETVAQLWVGTADDNVESPAVAVFQDKVVLNWGDKISILVEKCGDDFHYKVLETEPGFEFYRPPARWRSEQQSSG